MLLHFCNTSQYISIWKHFLLQDCGLLFQISCCHFSFVRYTDTFFSLFNWSGCFLFIFTEMIFFLTLTNFSLCLYTFAKLDNALNLKELPTARLHGSFSQKIPIWFFQLECTTFVYMTCIHLNNNNINICFCIHFNHNNTVICFCASCISSSLYQSKSQTTMISKVNPEGSSQRFKLLIAFAW